MTFSSGTFTEQLTIITLPCSDLTRDSTNQSEARAYTEVNVRDSERQIQQNILTVLNM